MDLLKYEKQYWKQGIKYIAGLDEAGRGPLAGPVVAACVILNPDVFIEGINDSKKITPKKRIEIFKLIKERAVDVSVGIANEDEIDDINILQATFLAMKRAVGNLSVKAEFLLIDGPYSDIKLIRKENIIKGDSKSASIGAASIVAKVIRDDIMGEYDKIYPEYGFLKHKGYGTKHHIEQLINYKATPIHRKSFRIVKNNLPNYEYYQNNEKFNLLALQLVATNFIKRSYKLTKKNMFFPDHTLIDFLFTKNNNHRFIKVINNYSGDEDHRNVINKENISTYINNAKNIILENEKDFNKEVTFDVILVEFKPKKKPRISILNNEKIY